MYEHFTYFVARFGPKTYQHTSVHLTYNILVNIVGTAVAQWLKCCATNRKFAGSIPAGVSGIFH